MLNEAKEMIFYLSSTAVALLCIRDFIVNFQIRKMQDEISELMADKKEKTEALMNRLRKINAGMTDDGWHRVEDLSDETEPEESYNQKYDDGICKNCVYKDCIDCRAHYYQELLLEKFGHEGWDSNLILQHDNRKDIANAAGECKFYCEDSSKIVTCDKCKYFIPGDDASIPGEITGNCLKERSGTYDEYSWCPYGERKE